MAWNLHVHTREQFPYFFLLRHGFIEVIGKQILEFVVLEIVQLQPQPFTDHVGPFVHDGTLSRDGGAEQLFDVLVFVDELGQLHLHPAVLDSQRPRLEWHPPNSSEEWFAGTVIIMEIFHEPLRKIPAEPLEKIGVPSEQSSLSS